MNLLAHLWLAPRGSPREYRIGATIPDLLSMQNRRCRVRDPVCLRLLDGLRERKNDWRTPLFRGMREHLAVDTWFHESGGFRASTAALVALFREQYDKPLHRFFSHVISEILIDRHLDRLVPALTAELKDTFRGFDETKYVPAFSEFGPVDPFRFGDLILYMQETPFVERYGDFRSVSVILGRMGRGMAMPVELGLGEKDSSAFIADCDVRLAPLYEGILAEGKEFVVGWRAKEGYDQ